MIQTRLSSIVSQPIKVVVHIDIVVVVVFIVVVVAVFVIVVVVMFVVDPRNLPLKSGQNWVPNSWDIAVVVDVLVAAVDPKVWLKSG